MSGAVSPGGFLIAGGGTAGHLLPGLAVADALLGLEPSAGAQPLGRADVHFVGGRSGVEQDLVPAAGFSLTTLPGRGINERKLSVANVKNAASILAGIVRGIGLVRRSRPRAVLSLGGYAALPAAIGAVIWRRPLIIAEQNARASLSNRVVSRWARVASVPVAGTGLRREVVTGNPIRAEVGAAVDAGRDAARRSLGWSLDATVLVVFGGSLGARRLNHATWAAARELCDGLGVQVHHVVGRRDWPDRPAEVDDVERYRQVEYESDLATVLAGADLAFCRAGGSTVSELAVAGLPSILVPLPIAPNDHQRANAEALRRVGAAVVIDDKDVEGDLLIATSRSILEGSDPSLTERSAAARTVGHRDAAIQVAQLMVEHAKS